VSARQQYEAASLSADEIFIKFDIAGRKCRQQTEQGIPTYSAVAIGISATARAGAMCAPIDPCRLSRPTGGFGIASAHKRQVNCCSNSFCRLVLGKYMTRLLLSTSNPSLVNFGSSTWQTLARLIVAVWVATGGAAQAQELGNARQGQCGEQDPETGVALRGIGTPCLVEADVSIASFKGIGGTGVQDRARILN
jgi:hypothetical protein